MKFATNDMFKKMSAKYSIKKFVEKAVADMVKDIDKYKRGSLKGAIRP